MGSTAIVGFPVTKGVDMMGAKDIAGKAQYLLVDASGYLEVNVKASVPNPNPTNTNGSQVTGNVSTVITLAPPANAIGFILQAKDANAANIRWGLVSVSTTTSGNQLEPGRDTGYVPAACNISICSESGTNEYEIVWVKTS